LDVDDASHERRYGVQLGAFGKVAAPFVIHIASLDIDRRSRKKFRSATLNRATAEKDLPPPRRIECWTLRAGRDGLAKKI
jgi:hypothetical protein